MRIACSTPIKDLDQKPVLHPTGEKATFRSIARDVLLARLPADEADGGQKCYQMYNLAKRLQEQSTCEISIEEAALLKQRVAACSSNHLVLGRMFDILEGKTPPELVAVAEE